jgi:ankyrin repeat protein
LIETGANINTKDNFDKDPLYYAMSSGSTECTKLLISKGAKFDTPNNYYLFPKEFLPFVEQLISVKTKNIMEDNNNITKLSGEEGYHQLNKPLSDS